MSIQQARVLRLLVTVGSTFRFSGGGDIARPGEAARFVPPTPAMGKSNNLRIL